MASTPTTSKHIRPRVNHHRHGGNQAVAAKERNNSNKDNLDERRTREDATLLLSLQNDNDNNTNVSTTTIENPSSNLLVDNDVRSGILQHESSSQSSSLTSRRCAQDNISSCRCHEAF